METRAVGSGSRDMQNRARLEFYVSEFIRDAAGAGPLPPGPGARPSPCEARCAGSAEPLAPKCGEVVPAVVERIALPTVTPVNVMDLSQRAHALLSQNLLLPEPAWSIAVGRVAEGDIPAYQDRALSHGRSRARLLARLVEAGLLRPVARRRLSPEVPFFCVAKAGNQVAGPQRLVCDLRQLNSLFQRPPRINLGSVEALACLDLSRIDPKRASLSAAGGDIQVWFYSILLPEEMWDLFTVPETARSLAASCRRHGLSVPLALDEAGDFHLGFCVPLMGWSFAPLVAQLALEDLLFAAVPAQLSAETRVAHEGPVPRLDQPGDVVHYEYLDDYGILALDSLSAALAVSPVPGAARLAKQIRQYLTERGLIVHKEQDGLPLESLGIRIDRVRRAPQASGGKRGVEYFLAPKLSRASRLYAESAGIIASGITTPRTLATLLGIWSWSSLCFRPFLSIFNACYKFLSVHFDVNPDADMELWPSVLDELSTAAALLPLLRVSLSAEWHGEVSCVDAGPDLGAVVTAPFPTSLVAEAGARGLRSGWSTHRAGDDMAGDPAEALTESRGLPPEPIDDALLAHAERSWRVAYVQTWESVEHNNVGEMRVLVGALRRAARSASGKRVLLLTDSLVAMGALLKGRSSSWPLLRLCRVALATCLGSGLRFAIRYVPTWINPADAPSRGIRLAGVAPETVLKALAKFRRLHAAGRTDPPPASLVRAGQEAGLDVADLVEFAAAGALAIQHSPAGPPTAL